jgi:alcohol dehydrogenase class IV
VAAPSAAAASGLKSSLQAASAATGVPLFFQPHGIAHAGRFAAEALRVRPGERCIVIATQRSAKRANALVHFLRKGGFLPLLCELPDGEPVEAHVAAGVAAAKRTGSTFVAAFGGNAMLSVGKAVAALLVNGGRVGEYARNLGGKSSLASASAPLLVVPSCPAGTELSRSATIVCDHQLPRTCRRTARRCRRAWWTPRWR